MNFFSSKNNGDVSIESNCFAINGNILEPRIKGVENVVKYYQIVKTKLEDSHINVKLNPIIKQVIKYKQEHNADTK